MLKIFSCAGDRVYALKGPIVRINPEEVSIHDPAFYSKVYITERKRRTDNYNKFGKGIDFDGKF